MTISEQLKKNYNVSNVSVLKGPCLAKELVRKNQTSVVIANRNIKIAKSIGKFISTKYYFFNDLGSDAMKSSKSLPIRRT